MTRIFGMKERSYRCNIEKVKLKKYALSYLIYNYEYMFLSVKNNGQLIGMNIPNAWTTSQDRTWGRKCKR